MGTMEASAGMANSLVYDQTQISVLRKSMESNQKMAMDLINKQQQVSKEIMESDGTKGQKIDMKA